MADRVDELLTGGIGKQQKKPFTEDRVLKLLTGEGLKMIQSPIPGEKGKTRLLQTSEQPTGAIDVRSGKPIMKPVSIKEKTADFGTLVKTGLVDDPQTKINILAKDRGISPQRYGIIDGEIVYLGDDGVLYYETRQTRLGKLKREIAEAIPHAPEIALSAALVPQGPGAVAIGAAGGAGIRKLIGSLAFKEPQTTLGNIKEMGIAAGTAYLGEKAGAGAVRLIDVSKGRKGVRLIKAAGQGRKRIDPVAMRRIEDLGEKHGIHLFSPQTTGSHELIARFNLLGDTPVTADKVGQAKLKQYAEIDQAIGKWLKSFAPAKTTPESAGQMAVEAAQKGIKSAITIRQNKARPLYEKAFESGKRVDIKPVINFINTELKTAKGNIRASLIKAKKILEIPDLPKKQKAGVILNEKGKPIIKPEKKYDTSLKGLNDAKIALDDEITKAMKARTGNVAHNYKEVKKRLLKEMDKVSPDEYAKARKIYSSKSDVVTQLTSKKGKIGRLAKLEGDDIEKASKMIFSPTASSPEIIKKAKPVIVKHGGKKAWNALIQVHSKQAFDDVLKTQTKNIGGQLRKRLFGNPNQRRILKAAMSPTQYRNFDDFMKVLERTGLTAGKESTTAPRLVSLTEMQEEALGLRGKILRATAYPLFTWKRILVDFRAKLKTEKYQNQLIDAMTSKLAARQLQNMLQLKPKSQTLIKRLGVFLTNVSEGHFRREWERSKRQDVLPPTLLKQSSNQKGRLTMPQ